MKTLFVNAAEQEIWEEKIDNEEIKGILDLGIYLHTEKYKSYLHDVFSPKNALIVGAGPFNLPGTQRASFVFRSPIHGALHSSTMGDFGEYIKHTGYLAICFEGKAEGSVFVAIRHDKVEFFDIELQEDVFSVEKELYSKLKEFYDSSPFRVCLCGLGAKYTRYGCLVSSKPGKIGIIPDVAGRGGVGSVLYRAHGIVGFAVGGKEEVEILQNREIVKQQIEATKKYREFGTFKANYPHLKEKAFFANWQSVYLSPEKRMEIFSKYILEILLKGYSFSTETCGERCVAACKKYENSIKIDYEPMHGMGPFIGIYKREYVRELVHMIDSFGIDAIYAGAVLGTVFEALWRGEIKKEEFSLVQTPCMNVEKPDSEINYTVAKELLSKICKGECDVLGENLRRIAKAFNISHLAFYLPCGKEFDMTPNFYWSLGLFLPVAMHGKYFTDYHTVVKEPEEYAQTCAKRCVAEYLLDNLGICRFHRGWAEKMLLENGHEEIAKQWISKLLHYKKLANVQPVFWESERTLDVVIALFREFGEGTWKNVDETAAKEYWKRWSKEYFSIFESL